MSRVHTVRPTDLVALVAFDGHVYPNEAVTRDRIGSEAEPRLLETALEQWFSFATGRHAWISVKGATLRGLVSARKRGSKTAWEIDCLIDAAEDDPGVVMSLLDQVAAAAGRAGVEKVFLRLPVQSDTLKTARSSGFTPYLTESLLAAREPERAAPGGPNEGLGPGLVLRRWGRADANPTFQLYNRWTPEPVRRVEAATFREWLAARERGSARRAGRSVVESEGRVVGWLRTAPDGELGRFELMADPAMPELTDALIDTALVRLREQSVLFSLVPEFATGLRERLVRRGFVPTEEFAVLARRIALPEPVPQLAPATPA